MSLLDYKLSQRIAKSDYPFAAIIMTAMRQADTQNLVYLRNAFPEIWEELQARYNAPGGVLEKEK